jgi:hypothetical protein
MITTSAGSGRTRSPSASSPIGVSVWPSPSSCGGILWKATYGIALRAVDGADRVWEDDREVWGVTGTVSGEALVRAAAGVVDHLADRARAYLDSLG